MGDVPQTIRSRLAAAVLLIVTACFPAQAREFPRVADASTARNASIETAFRERRSGVAVTGGGVVARVLPDDNDGSRHQRFILDIAPGQTVLIAHNIDLAPRLEPLNLGDSVEFKGVYEWNAKGGTIHWTHHDPTGRRPGGWLKSGGQVSR
jgi:hypothetical protein